MLGRLAAAAALIALAGCAGMESAGRNSRTSDPTPMAAAPAPPPPAARVEQAPVASPPPAVAPPPAQMAAAPPPPAQRVEAPPAPPAQRVEAPPPPPAQVAAVQDDRPVAAGRTSDEVIVPGQRERQVPAPNGDPRSRAERMQDIRAWDDCVMRVQNAFDADPMSAQLDVPEDYCARSLGMANRTAVPESRRDER